MKKLWRLAFVVYQAAAAFAAPAAARGDLAAGQATGLAFPAAQTAFGIAGTPAGADRTIEVVMSDDMRFSPAQLTVRRGETVGFVVQNRGTAVHEMVLGTRKELTRHAALMRKFPGMQHDEPWMVHVQPGRTETFAWTFNRAGSFLYACLLPGHFESGMKGSITVKQP
jgi:uncharacterized cupredoxin-like copper-binding protein